MSDIVQLQAEVRRLTIELHVAKKALSEAKIAASPIIVGSIYESRKGLRGKVVDRNEMYGSVAGVLKIFKKDGSLGKRTARTDDVHGWKLIP